PGQRRLQQVLRLRPSTARQPLKTPGCDKTTKESDNAPAETLSNSPWFLHRNRRLQEESSQSPGSTAQTGDIISPAAWQRQWQLTPRSRRVELLSAGEQQLVAELAKPDLTAKDKLRSFSQLKALPYYRQRAVLECCETLQGKHQSGD